MARDHWSVPDLLRSLGLSRVEATMVVPYVYDTPAGSDPSTQGVMSIVAALQNAYGMTPSGELDAPTQAAIRKKSGPLWTDKPWINILLAARGRSTNDTRAEWLGLEGTDGILGMSLPMVLGLGVGAYFLFGRR